MQVEEIREIYNKTTKEYDKLVTPRRICQFLTLIYELDLRGNKKILEVGCGPGWLSIEIGRTFPYSKVIGVDISENMIQLALENAEKLQVKNVQFEISDEHNLKFLNEHFDVVATSMLLQWSPNVHKFLSEAYRVLIRGGKIGLISPAPEAYKELRQAYQNLKEKYERYYKGTGAQEMIGIRIYSPKEIQELHRNAGFKITRVFIMNLKEPLTHEDALHQAPQNR